MPGAYAHITLVNELKESPLRGDNVYSLDLRLRGGDGF